MIWLSLPLGIFAWTVPILFRRAKPAAVSAVSFGLCGLALLNVLWEFFRRTVSGDYAALMDITSSLVGCSAALVIGTVLLNLRLYLPKQNLRHWFTQLSPFWGALILQTMYYLGVTVYAAYFGSHITGYHLGLRAGLLGLALSVILLIAYRIKARKQELSLHVTGAVLVFPAVEFLLFYLTMFLPGNALPYEYDDFLHIVLLCYYLPTLVLSVLILHVFPMIRENMEGRLTSRHKRGILSFVATLLLQAAFFLLPVVLLLCIGTEVASTLQLLYFGLILGLSIILFAGYLNKTNRENLSFGVPLGIAVFPALYELIMIQIVFRFSGLLFAVEPDLFRMLYYFPALLMTATGVGFLKLQYRFRKQQNAQKGDVSHESE